MMTKRRVLAITGIRSEYFLQRPIFQAIMDHPELELELLVTGAHLSPLHGYTVRQIEADGFPISDRIESLINSDRDAARLRGAASQLQVLAHIVDAKRPAWLLAPADREEAMTMALCGAYLGIPTAHYGAGDHVVGNVDDMVRHAVSRLAHLLLTTHEEARARLVRAGEEEWRVHNVGHSGLDRIRTTPQLTREDLARDLGVKKLDDRYLVIVQHPLSSEISDAGAQMRETLAAVAELGMQAFVSYPNSDPGSGQIIAAIREFESNPQFKAFNNIPDMQFVNLLRGATALLGNSSLGLLEAPFLHLAAINVGARQKARHHADNIFFVNCDRNEIVKQVEAIIDDAGIRKRIENCANPFGDGQTGKRVADLLALTSIDARLLNKDLNY
jgi:GDP/UDP-N,N'-diacetylbacillosamine 2-epimerase (hydrolysing)